MGYVGEEGENVLQVAVVALGPHVLVGRPPDELGRDPHATVGPEDRALEERVHPELARDVLHREGLALVPHHRVARGHPEGTDLRELGDERVVEAVHEVVLGGVVGEVVEGEDGDRADPGRAAFPRHERAQAGQLPDGRGPECQKDRGGGRPAPGDACGKAPRQASPARRAGPRRGPAAAGAGRSPTGSAGAGPSRDSGHERGRIAGACRRSTLSSGGGSSRRMAEISSAEVSARGTAARPSPSRTASRRGRRCRRGCRRAGRAAARGPCRRGCRRRCPRPSEWRSGPRSSRRPTRATHFARPKSSTFTRPVAADHDVARA